MTGLACESDGQGLNGMDRGTRVSRRKNDAAHHRRACTLTAVQCIFPSNHPYLIDRHLIIDGYVLKDRGYILYSIV